MNGNYIPMIYVDPSNFDEKGAKKVSFVLRVSSLTKFH